MSITFDSIPSDIRTFGQYIEINNSRAVQGAPAKPHKCLIIGQRMSVGTIAAKIPTPIPANTSGDAYFGARSQIAAMCRAFKKANPYTELWAVALDDNASGVARTMTLTVTGPATGQGTIELYIGGRLIEIPVAVGDAATAIATNINAAIQASGYYPQLPWTSAVASAVVTLTASNKGVVANGNSVLLNYTPGDTLPTGVGVTIAQGTAGSVDPIYTDATDALGDVQYDTIATAFNGTAALVALGNWLVNRWGPMVMKEGMAYAAITGVQSALSAAGNGLNSYAVSLLEIGGVVNSSPTPTYEAAATYAAVCALQATIDPARPLQTLALPNVLPPPLADQFTRDERNVLLTDGIATHYVSPSGDVLIERAITTYQLNPLGIADISYLDSETLRTLAQLRYEIRATIALKYPRHKLASDGTFFDPGQAVVTPGTLRAELISLFRDWETRGLVENFDQFKQDLIVERNSQDPNRVDMRMSPDLINQFRIFAGQIQFLL